MLISAKTRPLSVIHAIQYVLPDGTLSHSDPAPPEPGTEGVKSTLWHHPPDWPPDLFAVTGYLLGIGGICSYLLPVNSDPTLQSQARFLSLIRSEVDGWCACGREWVQTGTWPNLLTLLWAELTGCSSENVYRIPRRAERNYPLWWKAAYGLFVIADEASESLGYVAGARAADWIKSNRFTQWHYDAYQSFLENNRSRTDADHFQIPSSYPPTAGVMADKDFVCVQPKSRTASVGSTMRTLSHNLALLPPRGIAKVQWHRPNVALQAEDLERPLRLLVIPYPYRIARDAFILRKGTHDLGDGEYWLDLEQRWLREDGSHLVDFVIALVRQAIAEHGPLSGVVLPEDSLDWTTHLAIAQQLRQLPSLVEFVVSGASTNCRDEEGTFVLFTQIGPGEPSQQRSLMTTSRPKHHRWRLDVGQAAMYGLTGVPDHSISRVLPPDFRVAWETIGLPQREIHAHVVRSSTTVTALICEDLARSEPCHGIIRDIGPNIVISLLLDGPQLPTRWSARYARSLAEDPGASVLTLTSRGLVELANEVRSIDGKEGSWSVGLWIHDGAPELVEMHCPPGQHGLVVQLTGQRTTEYTLDGRANPWASSWRVVHPDRDIVPIALADARLTSRIAGAS